MNIANTENKTKKQVLDKELSKNPVKEILAGIESKFETHNSNLTNWNNDLKITLTQIDQLGTRAKDLETKIESENQQIQNLYSTMREFWSREVHINDLVHRLGDNYLPPSERTEIIAKLAAENKKNAGCEEENGQNTPVTPSPKAKTSGSGIGKILFWSAIVIIILAVIGYLFYKKPWIKKMKHWPK